jgi:hypothetical protein
MTVVIGFLVLAVLAVLLSGLRYLFDGRDLLFDRVKRSRRARSITTDDRPMAVGTTLLLGEAMDAVRDGLRRQQGAALLRAGLTVEEIAGGNLLVTVGNPLSGHDRFLVSANRYQDRTQVRLEVVRWLESDGVSVRAEYLSLLRDNFITALRRADPDAKVVTVA